MLIWNLKAVSSLKDIWIFDKRHLKDAVTLLLLNDEDDKEENDLELKALIACQFEKELDMKAWAMDFFDKV